MQVKKTRTAVALLFTSIALICGCDRRTPEGEHVAAREEAYRGVVLGTPLPRPAFSFPAADGRTFDFQRETEGKVALLFFGYTHCPDVCPLHMANIAAVLRRMSWEERNAIRVVFVTTDPARDTHERLREWLGNFDDSFVGLRAPIEDVNALMTSLGMRPAERDTTSDSTSYLVGHGAQVIAFGRDGPASLEYPFGIRQDDWAHDLPKLVRGEAVLAGAMQGHAAAAEGPRLTLLSAMIVEPATNTEAALYVTLVNLRAEADTLVSISTDVSSKASIHGSGMSSLESLELPPLTNVPMMPGGIHVMLTDLTRRLRNGDSVSVRFDFRRAGTHIASVPVVSYAQLDSLRADPPQERR
jgi:cytochrome oxidase Cu insertion factor (SCO1/SenC/PrrC family)/copper(I)-binding protein